MRRITIALTAAAMAAAATAAPAGAAQDPPRCDPGPCIGDVIKDKVEDLGQTTLEDVVWAVRCAGYALGGNPCY